jgi:hypothetical protein
MLAGFGPISAYDNRTQSLNVMLSVATSWQILTADLERVGLRPFAGLFQPSSGVVARFDCAARGSCETRHLTRCTFMTIVSRDEYDRHFRAFGERLFSSGYTVNAVLFAGDEAGQMILSISFYDQCDRATAQLAGVWREVTGGNVKNFRRQRQR